MGTLLVQRILLCEDGGGPAGAETRLLESFGYRVCRVEDEAGALRLADAADAALIVLNPGGGQRQARLGRALLRVCDLPLVLYAADEAAQELVEFAGIQLITAVSKASAAPFLQYALQLALGHKGIRQAHLDNEARLHAALEATRQGVWEWDQTTGKGWISSESYELLGYAAGEMGDTLAEWFSFIHPADQNVCRAEMSRFLRGKSDTFQAELRLRGKDGSFRWLQAHCKANRWGADGRPLHGIGTYTDIGARKQADVELRKWQDVFRDASWGVAVSSPDGLLLDQVNPAFAEMHGETPAELRGRPILDLFAPDSREDAAQQIRIATECGRHSYESWHLRSDGSRFPVSIDAVAVRDEAGKLLYRIASVQDISARRQAEISLRQSEERYHALFENMVEGFSLQEAILDGAGKVGDFRFLDANPAYQVHTGLPREVVLGRRMLEVQADIDPIQIEQYGRVALTGEPVSFEYFSRTYNRHLRVRAFSPQPGRVATIYEDVSEMRAAEEALRESEQKYRKLFENPISAMVLFDLQTLRILDANQTFLNLYGYAREELLGGMSALDLSGQEQSTLDSICRTKQTGADFVVRRIHRRKDGSTFTVEIASSAFTWQGRRTIFSIVRDISKREAAQQRLRESEERFRSVADSAPVLIWMAGPDASCSYVNAGWLRYTGQILEQALGSGWAGCIHPDDLPRRQAALGERREFELEIRLRRADGAYGLILEHGVPRITSTGEFLGYIGSGTDITARKQAEEQVHKLLDEKELLIREVHHRIKNNMATIAALLRMQARKLEDASAALVLREAENRVHSMLTIYDRLYLSGNYQQVNVQEYLDMLIDDISQTWIQPGQEVAVERRIESIDLPVKLSFPIGIVINECLTNAFKHAFVGRAEGRVSIELRHREQDLLLSVSDDGVGLPAEVDPRCSNSFGMLLLNGMASQLEADLEVQRSPGTAFRLRIPLAVEDGSA